MQKLNLKQQLQQQLQLWQQAHPEQAAQSANRHERRKQAALARIEREAQEARRPLKR
jgi:hypothetical protein